MPWGTSSKKEVSYHLYQASTQYSYLNKFATDTVQAYLESGFY